MFDDIFKEFDRPLVNLFTTRLNVKIPIYMSPLSPKLIVYGDDATLLAVVSSP